MTRCARRSGATRKRKLKLSQITSHVTNHVTIPQLRVAPGIKLTPLQGRVSVDEMKEHMDAFAASCDYPSSPHWKLQLQAFPDAKLIHTTRSPDTWAVSVSETIFLNQPDNPSQPLGIKLLLHTLARGMLPMIRGMTSFNGDYSHANLVKFFKEYEKHVLAEAPRNKLLVFKATDGWGPLCAHLGLPVPDEPYPNINDAAEFKRKIVAMNTAGWCFGALVACSAALLVRHALRHR